MFFGLLTERAEMADVEQTKKIIPFVTCEASFSQHVCDLVFGVNVACDLPGSPDRLSRRTPGRTPFHPKGVSTHSPQRAHPFPHHLFSVHDHGRLRSSQVAAAPSRPHVGLTLH